MSVSSSRILTTSSLSNTVIIPTNSSIQKNLLNPLQIGDTSLQKLRTITTTPVIKSTIPKPMVFILNNNSIIKSEPQIPINRLILSNNNNNSNLTTFVNSLIQPAAQNTMTTFLETPINVVQQPTISYHCKYFFAFDYFY